MSGFTAEVFAYSRTGDRPGMSVYRRFHDVFSKDQPYECATEASARPKRVRESERTAQSKVCEQTASLAPVVRNRITLFTG